MMDDSMRDQLRSVFQGMTSDITLRLFKTDHPMHRELEDLLTGTADTGERILVEQGPENQPLPGFEVLKNGAPTGIRFFGIPGGHEFSSLVLAILNADGRGKLPDAAVASRVGALARPVHLRTFVSLTCTNCPDVVQALNQLALLGDRVSHDFIDGAIWEEEVGRLGIQGVPAVFEGDALLHSGKAGLGELLEVLESHAGTEKAEGEAILSELFDVLV